MNQQTESNDWNLSMHQLERGSVPDHTLVLINALCPCWLNEYNRYSHTSKIMHFALHPLICYRQISRWEIQLLSNVALHIYTAVSQTKTCCNVFVWPLLQCPCISALSGCSPAELSNLFNMETSCISVSVFLFFIFFWGGGQFVFMNNCKKLWEAFIFTFNYQIVRHLTPVVNIS